MIHIHGFNQLLPIYTIDDFPYQLLPLGVKLVKKKNGAYYYNMSSAFDIETTTLKEADGTYSGFMYNWQFCIKSMVVMGKTWEEFQIFLQRVKTYMELGIGKKLVCYIHNASFEFQFMRNYFNVTKLFARKARDVVSFEVEDSIEFRCSYVLSNMNFRKLCENCKGVTFFKQDDYDYRKFRLPNTVLTEEELLYCYCDVRGLCECIDSYLEDDTVVTIPLTSTGFVRRECRKAVLSNKKNWYHMRDTRLNLKDYGLLIEACRGGNTHCNPRWSDILMGDEDFLVHSVDIKSSYPYQMMKPKYPMTKFVLRSTNKFRELLDDGRYALLIECTFYGLRMKHMDEIPYISRSKCTWYEDCAYDNGRIYKGNASMTITDIDFQIIEELYDYDSVDILSLRSSRYGYLPKEFRELLMNYFHSKEDIGYDVKHGTGDEYLYGKFKGKINAFFGMMLTSMLNDTVIYDPEDSEKPFKVEESNAQEALDAYYDSHRSFLSWQWGVWVCANARRQLQDMLNIIGGDSIYVDTDSVKFVGDYWDEIEAYNKKVREFGENADVPSFVEIHGKRIYLGEFTAEDDMDYFSSQGAKKYAYVTSKDKKLHITVAGLNKKKGAEYFERLGGIEFFKCGVTIPEAYSGRTVSYYKDRTDIETLTIDGCTFTRGSSIGIADTTYTLGVTSEYEEFRENLQQECDLLLTEYGMT